MVLAAAVHCYRPFAAARMLQMMWTWNWNLSLWLQEVLLLMTTLPHLSPVEDNQTIFEELWDLELHL